MMMPYIQIFADKEDALNLLGDAERGRLLSALMEYNRTGVCPQLVGNERLVFPFFREGLDAARRLYEAKATAGVKGGSKSKQKQSKTEAEAKQTEAEAKQTEAEAKQTEANDPKNKNKNISSAAAEETRAREGVAAADDDLNLLASQHTEVFAAAERMGFLKSQAHLDKLNDLLSEYDPQWIMQAMDDANDNNASSFAYLRKILERWKAEGGIHDGRKKAPEGGGSEWDNVTFLT